MNFTGSVSWERARFPPSMSRCLLGRCAGAQGGGAEGNRNPPGNSTHCSCHPTPHPRYTPALAPPVNTAVASSQFTNPQEVKIILSAQAFLTRTIPLNSHLSQLRKMEASTSRWNQPPPPPGNGLLGVSQKGSVEKQLGNLSGLLSS